MLNFIQPQNWQDYELIDSGNLEKLERFGNYILIRPEPQAVWSPKTINWEKNAHAIYKREKGKDDIVLNSEKGRWKKLKAMPDSWNITYTVNKLSLTFKLALTSFGHIGVFPEQGNHWEYIYNTVKNSQEKEYKVLNLFAYTGGSSLAAAAAGALVTHVDSIKQTVTWSNENRKYSKLNDTIRWVIEDALKFVKREAKRGNKYNGIILDPPAYGRGTDGEKWVLQENINELIKECSTISYKKEGFIILNLYSMGFSSLILENLINEYFKLKNYDYGELFLTATSNLKLPLGTYFRGEF